VAAADDALSARRRRGVAREDGVLNTGEVRELRGVAAVLVDVEQPAGGAGGEADAGAAVAVARADDPRPAAPGDVLVVELAGADVDDALRPRVVLGGELALLLGQRRDRGADGALRGGGGEPVVEVVGDRFVRRHVADLYAAG